MKKIVLKKSIPDNEIKPRWYGIAYRDYLLRMSICYPLGLNIIVGFARKLYHYFLSIRFKSVIDIAYEDGLIEGRKYSLNRYINGLEDGYKDCFDKILKRLGEY